MKTLSRRISIYISLFSIGVAMFSGLISLVPATAAADTPQFCQANSMYYDPTTQTCTSTNPSSNPAPSLNTGFWALPLPEQAKVWTELNAMSGCSVNVSGGRGGAINNQDPTKVSTWFRDTTVDVGSHVDATDGRLDCNDENGWLSQLINDSGAFPGNYSGLFNQGKGTPTGIQAVLTKALFPAGKPSQIPDQLKYWILMQAFVDTHGDTACAAIPLPTGTPDQIAAAKAKYHHQTSIWVSNGGQVYSQPWLWNNAKDDITVGPGVRSGATTYSCQALADVLSSSPEGLNLATAYANNDTSDDPTQPGGGDASDASPGCDLNGDPFTWFLCPVIDSLEGFVQKIDNFITEALTFNTDYFYDQTQGFKTAWNSFRILATGLLVIAGLIMIGSQALGLEMLDAYTIKKVLPRLLIAIIGISLSWPLTRYAIDFFNVVGVDVRDLIYSPFSTLQGSLAGGATAVLSGGAVVGLLALGPLAMLSFLATAALAVLVGFVIIMVRYLALLVIVIFAPIAIAAYVLPNTQKLWSLWKDNFLGLLIVFPIISAFIAIGKVFSAVSLSGASNGVFAGQTIMQITGLAAYFLPYFMLPIAFRLATGVIGTIAGFVNDRNRGAFDALKNTRKRGWQQHGARSVEKRRRQLLTKRSDIAAALQARSSAVGASGGGRLSQWSRRKFYNVAARQVGGYNIEADASAKRLQAKKEVEDQINTGDDSEPRGLTVNKRWALTQAKATKNPDGTWSDGQWRIKTSEDGSSSKRQFKTLGGAWVDEGAVDAAHARWGNDAYAQQAALAYELRKTNEDGDVTNFRKNYRNVAQGPGGWGMSDRQAGGAWKGATFEHQNTHLSLKHTNWKTGNFRKDDGTFDQEAARAYATELFEKKGAYSAAQFSAEEIEQMRDAYDNGNADIQAKIRATTETFMHDINAPGGALRPGADGEEPIPEPIGPIIPGGPAQQRDRITSSQGAAHVNQRVNALADHVGIRRTEDTPHQKTRGPGAPIP